MAQYYNNIFEYIKAKEVAYRLPIRMNDSWDWSMVDHIKTTENYNNSQLNNGKNEWTPIKNITRPILNLQHRTEDIELKDVQLYVDDPDQFHLSLLVKKYHDDVFVQENDLDTFFDELNVSRIDFGGGISKKLDKPAPEVVPLQSIKFCNQKDILGAPFALVHEYSPDELMDMAKFGWGKRENGATHSIDEVIVLSREDDKECIEVYEVHGSLPKRFAEVTDSEEYETRMFIVCFYQDKDSTEKSGVILYTAKEDTRDKFKLIKRDPVYGRGLGFGGAEELFEAQVWTTYDMIRMQNMLDAAAVTILKSTDPTVTAKHPNGLKHLKNLSIVDIAPNTDISQVDTYPRNMALFEKSVAEWEAHAQQMGGANDALMGVSPASGTPFKLQELVTQEGKGLHEYRRGQYAKHIEEIYNDWIIPHIQKQICKDQSFLSELSVDEIQYVADKMAINAWNKYFVEKVLSSGTFDEGEKDMFMQNWKDEFKKKGNKHFIDILKGEFKDTPLGVKVSVAGKSKNLATMTDKIVNIFRFAFSNPQGFAQVMQIPGMSRSFNEILEYSGLSPMDFNGIEQLAQQPTQQPTAQPSPMQLPAQPQLNGQ